MFEASRDGIFEIPGGNGSTWQQVYSNALTRLDVTYHSFIRTEQEWKLAQNSVEATLNGSYTATNEFCIASVKAKSASADLQSSVLATRDCACEAKF